MCCFPSSYWSPVFLCKATRRRDGDALLVVHVHKLPRLFAALGLARGSKTLADLSDAAAAAAAQPVLPPNSDVILVDGSDDDDGDIAGGVVSLQGPVPQLDSICKSKLARNNVNSTQL